MRKIFAYTLIGLLFGVGIVALIETDPGYLMVAYGQYTIESSLWVGVLLVALVTLAVIGLLKLGRAIVGGRSSISGWLGNRKSRKGARSTTVGLISYIEGNWQKSRQQLLKGVKGNPSPLLNYLMAARASAQLNEPAKTREYLRAAEASESEAGIAVELTQAELKLQTGQYEQALATLVRARRNAGRHPHVLDLLWQAYEGLRDWEALSALLPDLRKYKVMPEPELAALERRVALAQLEAGSAQPSSTELESLHKQWASLPGELKKDSQVQAVYVRQLITQGADEEAEKMILRGVKQQWNPELVALYAYVKGSNPARQFAKAQAWLETHGKDAQLLLCLGRLAARNEDWVQARSYFEESYKQERSPQACAELGRLLAHLGETRACAAYYREGLMLHETGLPDLPMPENVVPKSRRLTAT